VSAASHVLVVDDTAAHLRLAEVLLASGGFAVATAADAMAAIASIAARPPALILLDLQLPGMDGLTLAARLKAAPDTRDIPIVAMTAYAMRGDRERALAAGCDGYLPKPLDPVTFVGEIRRYLGG
jgi:CheY-like chemotaxis protein